MNVIPAGNPWTLPEYWGKVAVGAQPWPFWGPTFSFAPPFLCGVAGALACLVCPWPGVWRWAWVPPLLDPSMRP